METAHARWRGLLRGWYRPVGSNFVFDEIEAPVPEIMDDSL
jgi:hypothetical protein